MDKLRRKFEQLGDKAGRLKESIAYSYNPNHRHDEEHEAEIDRQRTAIAESHRFQSFGSEREGNMVKWYIDGHDYFWALSEILENAKESIMILDWWLTPELFLRRPPSKYEEYRLDRLLLRKAQQGVKINIMVYKEVVETMSMSSSHTKHFLEDLHENIAVTRHPDHLGGEITLYWSHHEKIVLVDNVYACIGGLDICFGRWSTQNAELSDVHPTDFSRTLYPGQDYNNARVKDFHDVVHWVSLQTSRLDTPRMAWHDVHTMMVGPVVLDIAQHFVERWNFVKALKYRGDHRIEYLSFPHVLVEGEEPPPAIARHPHLQAFLDLGVKYDFHHKSPEEGGSHPHGGPGFKGQTRIQALRSSADWSHGILTEHSIQNAYIQMISEASHYVYIENQFFVTNTAEKQGPVQNLIGKAIVERVLSAARSGKKFRVVIVIPAVPGFAGDLDGNSGTLAILGATYGSICRGPNSIMGIIKREGFDPSEYISVFHLRSYDRINNDPERLRSMAEKSGVDFDHAQASLARVFLGNDALESELEANKIIRFTMGVEGGEELSLGTESKSKIIRGDKKGDPVTIEIPLPQDFNHAWDTIHRFEQGGTVEEQYSDSVAHHAFQNTGSLFDEAWSGSEESERQAYVTEELYIHTKLLICDDRRVLIGSANLNDRSQLGDHDSEIAVVIEDLGDMIPSSMNGQPLMATRFAATLRRQLYKQHLGLIKPQVCPIPDGGEIPAAMRPVGYPHEDETMSAEDQLVMDPLSDEVHQLLTSTAETNEAAFGAVFHCVPAKGITTWKEYRDYSPKFPVKPGHVADPDMPIQTIKQHLDTIKGHIVPCPLDFLEKENLLALDASVNPVTLQIYL